MALFTKKSDQEKYRAYLADFRKKYIPKRYNQLHLMTDLLDPGIDHYLSISNRSDGKSYNHIHFLLNFSKDFGVGLTLVCRNFTVRDSYMEIIRKIGDESPLLDNRKLQFRKTQFYTVVIYDDLELAIITDLNEATNLKYYSNYIQKFPVIVYDEFLALESDYLPDEWERLKTIYGSINRDDDIPLIHVPKLIYLGNAVNFSSPILANLDLYNALEKHKINTKRQYENILLEMRLNKNANESRNLRAFNEKKDDMTYGKFTINAHKLATETDRKIINKNPRYIYVKLHRDFLKVTYNLDERLILLSVIGYAEKYDFNLKLNDNRPESVYLNEDYFDPDHYKKHNKGAFIYDNNHSKDMVTGGFLNLETLKISKIIKEYEKRDNKDTFEKREEVYKERYMERTKEMLYRSFFNDN